MGKEIVIKNKRPMLNLHDRCLYLYSYSSQWTYQSSTLLAQVLKSTGEQMDSPHEGPAMQKTISMFSRHYVIALRQVLSFLNIFYLKWCLYV